MKPWVYVQLTLHLEQRKLAVTYFFWPRTHDTVSATLKLVSSFMGLIFLLVWTANGAALQVSYFQNNCNQN
jgi:hypothetical protein